MTQPMLAPMLALIVWTFVIWVWMYATRIPAMSAAGLDPAKVKQKSDLDVLPMRVKQIADNYNHLHEQPTVFYALVAYCVLAGTADATNVALAWGYVGARVVHSLVQCTWNFVPVRFAIFSLGSLLLIAITLRCVLALGACAAQKFDKEEAAAHEGDHLDVASHDLPPPTSPAGRAAQGARAAGS